MRIIPKALSVFIFIVGGLPILLMLFSAFVENGEITVSGLKYLFEDQQKIILLKNSILLGMLTVGFSLLIGVPTAFFITKTDMMLKGMVRIFFIIPIFIPPYIWTLSWGSVLGKNGLMNALFGIGSFTNSFYQSIFGAAFIIAVCFVPIVILFVSDALSNIDKEIEEAALIEISRAKIFFHLTIPLIKSAILSSSILVFILTLSEFAVPMLLGVNVYTTEIFTQFSAFYNYSAAILLSLPLTIIAVILIYWELKQLKENSFSNEYSTRNTTKLNIPGRWNFSVFLFFSTVIAFLVLLPLLSLFLKSFPLESYTKALVYAEKPAFVSLWNSLLGAFILTILGFVTAYYVERKNKRFLDVQTFLIFAIPGTVLGIGLIQLWNRWIFSDLIYNSFIIVQLGYIARFLIITERLFLTAFKQIPTSFEESATVEGATQFQIFAKILIPILLPTFFISFILGFIFCFGELGTTIILYPAGQATLPISLYTIMANSPESVYSAMSIIILIPLLVIILALFGIQNFFQYNKDVKNNGHNL